MKSPLFLSVLALLNFSSCKKENLPTTPALNIPQSGLTTLDPLTLMVHLVNRAPADFSINISSSIGSGLYEAPTIKNGSTTVEAYTLDRTYAGAFTVNAQPLPFNGRSYFYQVDTAHTSAFLTGRTNSYELKNGSFINFTLEDYAMVLPIVSFQGIRDHKLPLDSGLTVSWNIDSLFPTAGKAIVIVSYEDEEEGVLTTFHKNVDPFTGSVTFTTQELSPFAGKPYIKVHFAKGSSIRKEVSGRTVAIENLTFSYSRIYRL